MGAAIDRRACFGPPAFLLLTVLPGREFAADEAFAATAAPRLPALPWRRRGRWLGCSILPDAGMRPIAGCLPALLAGTIVIAAIPWISIGFLK